MMIVTYDEHGGFYDHVSPLAIPMRVTTQEGFPIDFESTGLRVPAFVVSPLVKSGSVYRDPLDHTSILQLIADKFHGGKPYSADTEPRQSYLSSLSSVLNLSTPRTDVPSPPASPVGPLIASTKSPGQLSPATGAGKNSDAFQLAAAKMVREHPELIEHGLGQIAEAYKQQRATIA
jgi:phospholipase C